MSVVVSSTTMARSTLVSSTVTFTSHPHLGSCMVIILDWEWSFKIGKEW